jgi:hypothetical protein
MKLFVAVASYKGISDEEAKANVAADELAAAGHEVSVGVLKGLALLDMARAELGTAFRMSGADATVLQDDDVKITGPSMLDMIKCGKDVVTAPCLMRGDAGDYGVAEPVRADRHVYNVVPYTDPIRVNGVRLAETLSTGLGCVLVRRAAFDTLCKTYPDDHFRSQVIPGQRSYALFNSILMPANALEEGAPEDENEFLGDDRAFSARLRGAKITIWVSLDARTNHRGLEGCFGEEMTRVRGAGLVGPGGKPL